MVVPSHSIDNMFYLYLLDIYVNLIFHKLCIVIHSLTQKVMFILDTGNYIHKCIVNIVSKTIAQLSSFLIAIILYLLVQYYFWYNNIILPSIGVDVLLNAYSYKYIYSSSG